MIKNALKYFSYWVFRLKNAFFIAVDSPKIFSSINLCLKF